MSSRPGGIGGRRRIWNHRMTPRHKLVVATLGLGTYLVAAVVLLAVAVESSVAPADRDVVRRVLREQGTLLFWGAVLAVVVLGLILSRLVQRYVVHPRDLAAATRLVATVNPAHRLPGGGPAEIHQLAMAVNELADRYEAERADVATRVQTARADVEAERSRLAALMSDLTVAVLVCNADGRILLYNAAASRLLNGPGTVGGAVGLGRSVFAVVDRDLVAFALDRAGAHTATVTWGEALLRARVTLVGEQADAGEGVDAGGVDAGGVDAGGVDAGEGVDAGGVGHDSDAAEKPGGGEHAPTAGVHSGGFVVTLEDLTREAATAHQQDVLVRSLTAAARASVANIRAAVESVVDYPDMAAEQQARFLAIVQDEATALTERLDATVAQSPGMVDRRLAPADMLGGDLLDILAGRLKATGLQVDVEDPGGPLWLVVDGYAVVRAVTHLGERLLAEHERKAVRLRLGRAGGYARLDLGWAGPPVTSATLERWITAPLAALGPGAALTVSEVLHRHGGEIWPGEDTHHVYLRLLLPLAERPPKGPRQLPARAGGHRTAVDRPASSSAYDFSLLEPEGVDGAATWDDRPLERVSYTVFDTETTGLFPAEGDEIISIGALRIVNRRLLRQETYEQLVDPRRTVPDASIRIHGIVPELLVGMPTIDAVLPGFAGFAADTVLVGHNVAFDLQFLRAKEAVSGVRFEQPVLDTLLLSAVVHPEHESHSLDAIAERLGIDVIGRHTALGDAIVTGEVFLRLLELLEMRGIRTVGEARDAARATAASRFSESLYTHT